MKKIRMSYCLPAIIGLLSISGCSRQDKDEDREVAAEMFADSHNLITYYTDSLKNAKDSMTLERIESGLTEELVKVNFKYPADTDVILTEEENDSIFKMLSRFKKLYNEKLVELSKRNEPDSAYANVTNRELNQ